MVRRVLLWILLLLSLRFPAGEPATSRTRSRTEVTSLNNLYMLAVHDLFHALRVVCVGIKWQPGEFVHHVSVQPATRVTKHIDLRHVVHSLLNPWCWKGLLSPASTFLMRGSCHGPTSRQPQFLNTSPEYWLQKLSKNVNMPAVRDT